MRPIDKFILHVVHNWTNELNEAYSEKAIQTFIKDFQDQADELNVKITDDDLRRYINIFDRIKEKLPAASKWRIVNADNDIPLTNNFYNTKEEADAVATKLLDKAKDLKIKILQSNERDLSQYSLPNLIKLATSVEDKDAPKKEIDITPDVVFPKPGDPTPSEGEPGYGIVIFNGSREDLCVKYGKGEKWCITQTAFPTYRGSEFRGYPTFYLARNTNLDQDNYSLSFVAIQVRDPEKTDPDERYVYTNRKNSPHESRPMSFSQLLNEVPWLGSIPNIQSILQYIKLSPAEEIIFKYKGSAIPIEEWINLDFDTKKGYLIQRKNKELFKDIDESEFIRNYLSDYPELAIFIAKNYGILPSIDLLRNLDKFNNQDRRSITANLQEKINIDYLSKSTLPFEVKQLLVQLDKWNLPLDKRLYNTTFKNDPTIAELILDSDGDINVNLYLKTAKYKDIKGRAKYIANYPQLDRLPFKNLMWAASNGIIGVNKLDATLETAKDDPSSPLIVKDKENGKLVLDANSYNVYNLEGESAVKIPMEDNEAQEMISAAKTNPAFQENTVNIVKQSISNRGNIPFDIDREAFISTIEATPYSKRTIQTPGGQHIVLKPENEPDDTRYALFARKIDNKTELRADYTFGSSGTWRAFDTSNQMSQSMWAAYFKYLRSVNQPYTDDQILAVMRGYDNSPKRTFIRANPPLAPNSRYAVAYYNDAYYLIDKINPRESKRLSDRRDTLNKTAVPPELLRQVLGQPATPTPTPRPVAPAAQAAPAALAAPVAQVGNDAAALLAAAGLTTGFTTLPVSIQQRIQTGTAANPRFERTARSRDAELGNRGTVTGVIVSGQSKMVIIRLASGRNIAQISIQPEARHYIVTSTTSFNMGRVGNFIGSLDQRNLSEAARRYVKKYPHKLNKVREILYKYISEIKKH